METTGRSIGNEHGGFGRCAGFLILVLIAPFNGSAQNVTLGLASGAGSPGTLVALNVSLNAAIGNQPAGVQWSLNYSGADFSSVGFAAGGAATAAGKSISCNSGSGTATCVVWGINSTLIQNGVVATITFTISPSTLNTSSIIQLSGGLSASVVGAAISTTTTGGVVTIVQPTPPSLTGVSCAPSTVSSGQQSNCTITLSNNALSGGYSVSLSDSAPLLVSLPSAINVPGGTSSTTIVASTFATPNTTPVTITATAGGVNVSTTLTLSSTPCTYTLTPGNRSYSAGGGSGNVAVAVAPGCGWTATTDSPTWITLATGGVSGNGNGSFVYSVPLNMGLARLGTITVGNQSFKVMEGGSVSVQPFNDVLSTAPFFDYISLMSGDHITAGCSTTPPLYCPDTPVTRAQMAVFVVKALDLATGTTLTYTPTPYFLDLPASGSPDSIYFPYVQRIKDLGITAGCSTNPPDYCPDISIPQGQMAVFMIKSWMQANNLTTFTYTLTPYFTDVPSTDPFFKFIQKMRDMGFWTGCSTTQYCETAAVTRADMAPMVMRAIMGAP